MSSALRASNQKLSCVFYQEIIENILELLDDQKPKVRQAARETIIAMLLHSTESFTILENVKEFLEKDLYEYILQRIENPNTSAEIISRNVSMYGKEHRSVNSLNFQSNSE